MIFDENNIVPLPVNFNCWKHHSGFIRNQTNVISQKNFSDAEIKKLMLVIGNSQMDIYLGKLSPEAIGKEILQRLKKSEHYSRRKFKEWIYRNNKDYKLLKISDKSVWTLRLGIQSKQYIHIHPGRYSPNTTRVKATTLKTAIAFMIKQDYNSGNKPDLKVINDLRENLFGLPPLKSVNSVSGLGKLLALINTAIE